MMMAEELSGVNNRVMGPQAIDIGIITAASDTFVCTSNKKHGGHSPMATIFPIRANPSAAEIYGRQL